jgi:hypothetical protein
MRGEAWALLGVGMLAVALVLVAWGARRLGAKARQRRIEATGKDPADNAVNRFFQRHPWAAWVLGAAFVAVGVAAATGRASS